MTSQERFNIAKETLERNGLSVCTLNLQQFDKLTELEILNGKAVEEVVEKIKKYEEYVEADKMEYSEEIMRAVRQNLGLDEMDLSRDMEIYQMDNMEILSRVCNWNGLVGYGDTIVRWIESIWQIELDD